MARYTGLFTVAIDSKNMELILKEILDYCNCEILYSRGEYLMAREFPGQVSFAQLVTVEITFNRTFHTPENTPEKIQIDIVVRNEELALKSDNHCRKMFILLSRLIAGNSNWELLESII